MRTQLVFRADKLTGPYEGRVALQDQGVAQGGLIDTPEGDWFALLFQDHGAVGPTSHPPGFRSQLRGVKPSDRTTDAIDSANAMAVRDRSAPFLQSRPTRA